MQQVGSHGPTQGGQEHGYETGETIPGEVVFLTVLGGSAYLSFVGKVWDRQKLILHVGDIERIFADRRPVLVRSR